VWETKLSTCLSSDYGAAIIDGENGRDRAMGASIADEVFYRDVRGRKIERKDIIKVDRQGFRHVDGADNFQSNSPSCGGECFPPIRCGAHDEDDSYWTSILK
jgi:hypothetical protein